MDWQPLSPSDATLAQRRRVSEVVSAAARVVLAPTPLGAVALQATAELQRRRQERIQKRVRELGDHIARLGFTVAQLEAMIGEDVGAELFERVLKAASEAREDEQIMMLAAVLANRESHEVDEQSYLLGLVSSLDADQVRILCLFDTPRPAGLLPAPVKGGLDLAELAGGLPDLGERLPVAIRRMAANNLIKDVSGAMFGSTVGQERWGLAPYGERLLDLLRAVEQADA